VKLLHVVASYLPAARYGGTVVSAHGLCRALAARGHDVHVYTTSVNGPDDSDVPHGVPVDMDGVKVWYFRCTSPRFLYRAPGLGRALRAKVHEFDVVHTQAVYLWPMWVAARAARRAGVPYIVSPRGMLERDLISRKRPFLKALWIAAIERHNLERAAAIHVTSMREANEAAALGLNLPRMHEIPNGLADDDDMSGPVSPAISRLIAGGPFVLFLGRLNWKKGIDRLLAAAVRLPDVRVVVAGNDEDNYLRVVETLSARHDLAGRVHLTGDVRGADKAALLQHAALLALPSYSENFGNVVIEAMAAGRPVIVSKDVGLAAMVEEQRVGLVVDGDAGGLAAAIARVLNDAALAQSMGERGRSVARRDYSWAAAAADMEALYASVHRIREGAA
jgi:glycosyltransferase involved in cell wall biosynthesis